MREIKHSKDSIYDLMRGDCVEIGTTRYLVERVARGGMGLVYLLRSESFALASSIIDRQRIALKVPILSDIDESAITSFKRELALWAGFNHPCVLPLDEILIADGDRWVASMEWCHGSLRDIIKQQGRIPVDEACEILLQVISALNYAQKAYGIIHLDIKPENILYRYGGYFISDWGIASLKQNKLNKALWSVCPSSANGRTLNNVGTLAYMAPERFIQGYTSSTVSDVFSLGVTFIELISGSLPFDTQADMLSQLRSGEYLNRAARLCAPLNLHKDLNAAIACCLVQEPKSRWKDYERLHVFFNTGKKTPHKQQSIFNKLSKHL